MPRSYSLSRKKEIDLLFRKGARLFSRHFTIVFQNANELKFAIVVQKKNVKLASHRNYSRRVIREILRKDVINFFPKKYHIGILVKDDLKDAVKSEGFDSISADLLNTFDKASSPSFNPNYAFKPRSKKRN